MTCPHQRTPAGDASFAESTTRASSSAQSPTCPWSAAGNTPMDVGANRDVGDDSDDELEDSGSDGDDEPEDSGSDDDAELENSGAGGDDESEDSGSDDSDSGGGRQERRREGLAQRLRGHLYHEEAFEYLQELGYEEPSDDEES